MAFGRFFLFGDLGLTGHAQLGFVGGHGKRLAHLFVHDFVVHRVAITLGHHVHRHLARTEAVHLDVARHALEAVGHLGLDDIGWQRQRDLALKLFQGFNGHGHGFLQKGSRSTSLSGSPVEMRLSELWCAGGDSNPHTIAGVRT